MTKWTSIAHQTVDCDPTLEALRDNSQFESLPTEFLLWRNDSNHFSTPKTVEHSSVMLISPSLVR